MSEVILELDGLRTYFYTDIGIAKSVDGVSYNIRTGETLGVVGESGCGKSVTALSIMGLIPQPPGKIVEGSIKLGGLELTTLEPDQLRSIRGKRISMIFQEPLTSLNPVYTAGAQIIEALAVHEPNIDPSEARRRAIDMLRKVGIPSPEKRVDEYPHQMSGGMLQRVMIAMSLICGPDLLIADEPTTALDVTIQAQILDLLRRMQEDLGMSILLITHDLGVVAETCDRVVVMYAGKVAEQTDVHRLFERPAHPYTVALFQSLPDVSVAADRLPTIPGMVPSAYEFPSGCRFRDRCAYANEACLSEPPLVEIESGHQVACHHIDRVRADHAGGANG
ncbi:MAG: ABC transporter ATP-binding protein [Proteobacteria bacterium]|nr:ABC transporter ATP-binding protein [Pseudomonadota bacterium]